MFFNSDEVVTEVDVLICGEGSIGLLISCCLERHNIFILLMKQHSRVKQTLYERAAMKLFDQFDMANALKQIEFVMRKQISYNNEKRVD